MKSTKFRRALAVCLALAMVMTLPLGTAFAKSSSKDAKNANSTVENVLFYVVNSSGEQVLVSQMPVSTMESDLKSGAINKTVHNYSVLDNFVTTVHQEGQGFTVPEFVTYAKSKSTAADLKNLNMTFAGSDKVAFWEIDQTDFDLKDTYTYDSLYGTARYNFPKLYEYFNYDTQKLYDPSGKMSSDEVVDYLMKNAEKEQFILSVCGFSQRFNETPEKYDALDYDMENYWYNSGKFDSKRALRMLIPMTESDLKSLKGTLSNSRYWVSRVCLDMAARPSVKSLGKVEAPTATVTEDDTYYYVKFACKTDGATIYYNGNYASTEYAPATLYTGTAVKLPKSDFPEGYPTITVQAVKDGYTDAGVQTIQQKASGTEGAASTETAAGTTTTDSAAADYNVADYTDVKDSSWFKEAVTYVTEKKLVDGTSKTGFGPGNAMDRKTLAIALYRLAGSPEVTGKTIFNDVTAGTEAGNAVEWCYTNKVVNGKDDTTFDPNGDIKRQEVAAMLYRYAEKAGKDLSAAGDLSKFTDNDKIQSYATEYMKWAVGSKFINGYEDSTVRPRGTITRAEVAQILLNYSK